MRTYVTVFDHNFILQGLALYDSLIQHAGDFRLFVVAVDELCADWLGRLNLPGLLVLTVDECASQELLQARKNRTHKEFCWTLASHSYDFVRQAHPSVGQITYLDTDTFFFSNPEPVFDEFALSGKDILLTEHAYSEEHTWMEQKSGRFCVQFMPVNCTVEGLKIISQWQKQCRASCPGEAKDGIFGDQAYLESWPDKYAGTVHICSQPGWFLAPWNAGRFLNGKSNPLPVLYHFQSFRFLSTTKVQAWFGYRVPKRVLPFYRKYLKALNRQVERLQNIGVTEIPFSPPPPRTESLLWLRRFKWRWLDRITQTLSLNGLPCP